MKVVVLRRFCASSSRCGLSENRHFIGGYSCVQSAGAPLSRFVTSILSVPSMSTASTRIAIVDGEKVVEGEKA